MHDTEHARPNRNRRNGVVVGGVMLVLGGMTALTAYSSTLYEMFCRVTGYGGTTQQADTLPDHMGKRVITVRFDANTSPDLKWRFKPLQISEKVHVGENGLALYEAVNNGDRPVVGTATYSVTPHKAGIYFNKLQCFCFTEQVLQPGERIEMPVSYFVDPAIVEDRNLDDVTTITLSYTFFPAHDQSLAGVRQTSALKPADAAGEDARVN